MKFVDRLKFTAAGTSAATVTFGAAVAACRTLAQAITDGALVVGDTGVPFTVDDGVGNWETALFTVTSATVLTRTATLASSAGGTNPATFTGANLSVFNNAPASYLSAATASASVTGTPAVGSTLVAALPPGITGTLQWTRSTKAIPPVKTAISGAVANAVNSLAYVVQTADAGFALGCDASNTVVASTGVSIPAGPRINGLIRLFGTQGSHQEPAPGTSASTGGWVWKMQAPAGAIGARVSIHNKSTLCGTTGFKAAMAPTDISAIDTVAHAYAPQVAGVVNNTLYNATTNPYGFSKATWNGATQSRRIGTTNMVLPGAGTAYTNQEDTVTSDLMPLTPVKASDRAGTEYYYILRLTSINAVGDAFSYITPSTLTQNASRWVNSNGADTLMYQVTALSADLVDGSLTSLPVNTNMSNYCPMVSVEWVYPPNVTPITIWNVGDSLIEGYQWPTTAIQRKNTNPLRPIHHVNLGGSTTRTESFLGNLYLHMQQQTKPDYVNMAIISPNNYTPLSAFFTLQNADFEYQRMVSTFNTLAAMGIKMIWWVPVNYAAITSSYSPGPGAAGKPTPGDYSTPWPYLYNKCKEFAAANGILFVDIGHDAAMVWVDNVKYNTPAGSNMTTWNGDNTHPSDPVGIAGFVKIYSDALSTIGI